LAPTNVTNVTTCKEKVRLILEYSSAVRNFSDAVAELYSCRLANDHMLLPYAIRSAESCRIVVKHAKSAFEAHMSRHRCWYGLRCSSQVPERSAG